MTIITKPITLETLRNNVIKIQTDWESDINSDYDSVMIQYFWFKDGVLREYIGYSNRDKPNYNKPSLFSRTKMGDREAVTYINSFINKPKKRGYYDGRAYGMGTYTYKVSMEPNPVSNKTEKTKKETVRGILGKALDKAAYYGSSYMDSIIEEYEEKPKPKKKSTSKSSSQKKTASKSSTTQKKKSTASKTSTAKKKTTSKSSSTAKKKTSSQKKRSGCR